MALWFLRMIVVMIFVLPQSLVAQGVSLFGETGFLRQRGALISPRSDPAPGRNAPTLFSGRAAGSLLAPYPQRQRAAPVQASAVPPLSGGPIDRLRQIIGRAESHRAGYDAIQYAARRLPGNLPTQMTIGEIFDWIEDTPGQQHAIGRYQFIPVTLRRLVRATGTPREARFSPQLQDRLADVLLSEAGLEAVSRGHMPRHDFMHNLAGIWAGLPTATGQSRYHGIAGNRASITWADFDAEMARIFPG